MEETTLQVPKVRKSFSVIGIAFTVLIAVATVTQLGILCIPKLFGLEILNQQSWWKWLCASAPMYLFAFPACWGILQILPGKTLQRRNLTQKQFMTLLPICFCLMYAGYLVGTVLSFLLSGGNAVNALNDYAMDSSPLKVLVMVILAPLLEELICRKLLIDRTAQYGEKISVLMSGLIFGLLHQNLYQFFYAFALGCLFGFVYIRTGRLCYTVILHTIINFLGGVVAPAILSLLDMEAIDALSKGDITPELLLDVVPGYLALMAYSSVLMGMSVFGVVLLIMKLRRLSWKESELPFPSALKASFINFGMILYFAVCTVMIILALFNK